LEFSREIRVSIPMGWLRKLYKRRSVITQRERRRIKRLCAQIEVAEKRLAHARSVVERLLLRWYQ